MQSEITIHESSVLIRISRLYHEKMSPIELYEATIGVWKIGVRRDEAKYAFSVSNGIIREIYKIDAWLPAGTLTYETRPFGDIDIKGRWEFQGTIASDEMRKHYLGQSIKHYFARGASNPITYINCK